MQVLWVVGDENALDWGDEYPTYEDAASAAKEQAKKGRSSVVYKAVPCALFKAKITVEVLECEQ
jgi:hypothetical protein